MSMTMKTLVFWVRRTLLKHLLSSDLRELTVMGDDENRATITFTEKSHQGRLIRWQIALSRTETAE